MISMNYLGYHLTRTGIKVAEINPFRKCMLALCILILPIHALQGDDQIIQSTSSELLGCNSLKGFSRLVIYPIYSIEYKEERQEVEKEISSILEAIGKVVPLKVPDSTGFGDSEGGLFYQITKKKGCFELSLRVAADTIIKKTGTSCRTYIWTISDLFEGDLDRKKMKSAVNLLTKKFVKDFQEVNKGQKNKTLFYFYQP